MNLLADNWDIRIASAFMGATLLLVLLVSWFPGVRVPRKASWISDRWFLVAVLAVFAGVNTCVYIVESPPSLGEDEGNYFSFTEYVASEGRIPKFGATPLLATQRAQLGPDQPPFSYQSYVGRPGGPLIIAAAPLSLSTDRVETKARAARLPGMIYAALFVVFVYLAAMGLGAGGIASLGAAAAAATWPRVSNVLSTLNDDGFTMVAVAAMVWLWARGARNGWRDRDAAFLGLALGTLLLGKPNGFFPAALSLFVLFSMRGSWKTILRAVAFSSYFAVVVAGWRYAIAYSWYGTDFLASDRFVELERKMGLANLPSAQDSGFHSYSDYLVTYVRLTFETFVGPPGYLTVPSGHDAYVLMLGLVGVAVVGWISRIVGSTRPRRATVVAPLSIVRAATALIIPVSIIAVASFAYFVTAVPNGKYWMPATSVILIGIFKGLDLAGGGGVRSISLVTAGVGATIFANIELLNEVQRIPWGTLDIDASEWLRPTAHRAWILMVPVVIAAWSIHAAALVRRGSPRATTDQHHELHRNYEAEVTATR